MEEIFAEEPLRYVNESNYLLFSWMAVFIFNENKYNEKKKIYPEKELISARSQWGGSPSDWDAGWALQAHPTGGCQLRDSLSWLGNTSVSPRWTGGGLSITAKAATPMTLTWVNGQKIDAWILQSLPSKILILNNS